jgi:hypothetical protein
MKTFYVTPMKHRQIIFTPEKVLFDTTRDSYELQKMTDLIRNVVNACSDVAEIVTVKLDEADILVVESVCQRAASVNDPVRKEVIYATAINYILSTPGTHVEPAVPDWNVIAANAA